MVKVYMVDRSQRTVLFPSGMDIEVYNRHLYVYDAQRRQVWREDHCENVFSAPIAIFSPDVWSGAEVTNEESGNG